MRRRYLLLLSMLLSLGVVLAQTDRGTITGVAMDSTGSMVPGVQIVVRNDGTAIESVATSGSAGTYTVPALPIGSYTIVARLPGFKTYVRNQVLVQVGQTTRADITLEVGGVEERVTVSAEAPLLNVETSDVGIVVNSEKFLDLPLTLGGDIRNPSAFIFLSPGVSGNTWEKHIGGGASFTDAVYYDGAVLSGPSSQNDGQYNPSVDSIAEFKLITNDYAAEYGHALAGVTSFTLKSGTNRFHGSAFEFFRNEKLDARGFFPLVKAPTRQNEFGGTFGGPIRRNQTFFFVTADSFRRRQGSTQPLITVPLPDFLRGDFRNWTTDIYDPASTTPDGRGGFVRTAFPGRTIPTSRFSQVSRNIVGYFPTPHFDRLTNNHLGLLGSPMQDAHNWTAKVDHQFNSTHKLFGTFIFTNRPAIKGGGGFAGPPEDHNRQDLNSRLLRIGEDWTMSPRVLNHFVASLNRTVDANFSLEYQNGWPSKLGLRGVEGQAFPRVTFAQGFVSLGNATQYRNARTGLGFVDTLSVIVGKHSFKLGGEVLRRRENLYEWSNSTGNFGFSNLETAIPGDSRTGNAIASFLLGEVDSANALFFTTGIGGRWTYYALFAQDDYKVTPKLTLNLGLRWELQTPFTDTMDRLSYMDSSLPNPGAGNRPGAYTFGGDSRGGWRTIANTNWSDFGPRIGFAYNVAKDWVIRSGYGIFYWNVSGTIGVPATGFNTTAAFASGNVGITPAFNWDNGFPQDFQKPPILTPTVQNGQNATAVLRHRGAAWPYNQQWNLTVERQFGRSFAIRTGYVGMKGTRLRSAANLNQVHPSYLSLGSVLNTNITSAQAQAAGLGAPFPGFASLWGTRATVAQALRPFPQYATVGQFNPNDGSSNYHSFQLYAQKQMSQGIDFTASYTFSKVIDDVSTQQNFYDRRADRSIGNFHQPHVVSLSYVYNLPFGPGKRFLNGSSGLAGKIAGGWTLSGLHRYSSGLPLSLSVTNNLPIFNGGLRPNAVAGADQRPAEGPGGFDPARDRYINASAFALPPAFTFGNSARYLDNLLGPAGLSEAFAILKNTGIGERVNLQFRTEISNPFNRVVFGSPATNLSSPNFGQISSQADTPRVIQLGLKLLW